MTAKEQLLLAALRAHPNQVCDKDDLIRAVWPEDRIFMQGVRDDSLAQLAADCVRRWKQTPPSRSASALQPEGVTSMFPEGVLNRSQVPAVEKEDSESKI